MTSRALEAEIVRLYYGEHWLIGTLTKYPTLCASRLYNMVKERGYPGAPDRPPLWTPALLRLDVETFYQRCIQRTLPADCLAELR